MMIDRLFLSRNCPDCAAVRAELDMDAVMKDDFRGVAGQELRVYSALSNDATRELLDRFGLDTKDANGENLYYTPILIPHDGSKPRVKLKNIINWLRDNGMTQG
jgi:hypothetical protein